jgi:hypothetical protein
MAPSVITGPRSTDAKDVAEGAGRAGLVARGVVYVVVAILAARIALGSSGNEQQANQRGALAEVAQHSFGTALLVLLAVGFGGYALWRVVRAFTGEESSDDPEPHQRLADLGRAAIYVSLLFSTIGVLRDDGGQAGGGNNQQEWTARLMTHGWGRWLVGLVGAAVLAGGVWMIRRGFTEKFRKHLERLRGWVVTLGKWGHVGRGIAFVLIGGFVVRAAVRFDPNQPIGLDAALRDLAQSGWGRIVVLAIAAGLGAFGLFSMAESRDRRVLE